MRGWSGPRCLVVAAIVTAGLVAAPVLPAGAAPPDGGGDRGEGALVRHLRTQAGQALRMARRADTGRVRFLGSATGRPIESRRGASKVPQDTVARTFLRRYAGLFGASAAPGDLRVLRTSRKNNDASGTSAVRFQQLAGGVPVLGGELVVNMDRHHNVLSASGETTPAAALPEPTVSITSTNAASIAVAVVARDRRTAAASLSAGVPALRVYDPALLGVPGTAPASLVWQVAVNGNATTDVHRMVFVDATTGFVRLNFDPNPQAKVRQVCDRRGVRSDTDACTAPYDITEGGSTARASTDAINAYLYAGDTYDFFKSRFGRDSLDGKGLVLKSTVRYCPKDRDDGAAVAPCPFPNAYWNGEQMVYGAGFASADDVVGHELTHGVTQNEANLFSLYQAGAITESISDIFGELIDQSNAWRGRGRDSTGTNGTVDYRWLLFEDAPGGVGRNMRDPTARKDPDRIRSGYYSAENEWSDKWDNGGVHANAGVGNKAAYFMAVGGTFNLRTIDPASALGNEKLAQLYYRVLTQHLTSGSDYADLADALQQSCAELVAGGPISAAATTLTFVSADCDTVKTAVEATEMYLQPIVRLRGKGATVPTGATNPEAPICDPGQQPSYDFFDNLEHPAVGNWVTSRRVGARDWFYPQIPNPLGLDLRYAKSGRTHMFADDPEFRADFAITTTRAFVPTPTSYLRFDHSHVFDFNYDTGLGVDSGVVEASVDGGKTFARLTPGAGEDYGPVVDAAAGNNSAIHGRAFVGDSHGYVSSRFFLGDLAGQSVKIRFRTASDARFGNFGWFIDDVRVYDCAAANTAPTGPPPPPVITSVTPAEDGIGVVWSAAVAPTGILGYVVTATSPGHTKSASVRSGLSGYTLRGLSGSTSYTVTVRAHSAFGDSLSVPSAAVTPANARPPAQPRACQSTHWRWLCASP